MRYRMMGATGIRVSEIGFGSGDNAGLLVKGEPQEQIRAIERALELGINYFDTSPDYGKGLAETNIGKAMREIGFRPVLTTKVEIMPDELDHIADAVVESVEDSLERLQVDWVDVIQLHNPPSIETDTTHLMSAPSLPGLPMVFIASRSSSWSEISDSFLYSPVRCLRSLRNRSMASVDMTLNSLDSASPDSSCSLSTSNVSGLGFRWP